MNTLLTYATIAGSTQEIAEVIAETLRDAQTNVDLRPIDDAPQDVSDYDAVVIGSAIRMGAWLNPATSFVIKNRVALRALPTALFTVSITLAEDTTENRDTVHDYTKDIEEMLEPVDVGLFAGVMDPSKLGVGGKLAVRMVKPPMGDFRDWDAIRAWARSIKPKLITD